MTVTANGWWRKSVYKIPMNIIIPKRIVIGCVDGRPKQLPLFISPITITLLDSDAFESKRGVQSNTLHVKIVRIKIECKIWMRLTKRMCVFQQYSNAAATLASTYSKVNHLSKSNSAEVIDVFPQTSAIHFLNYHYLHHTAAPPNAIVLNAIFIPLVLRILFSFEHCLMAGVSAMLIL